MKTIHIILNAHIDPIWLWTWEAGIDEILATCRSACDRLDAHPETIFSRGEAWVYRQIEMLDAKLFDRIGGHIANGRWEIVGGWWIQPDCNLPSGWAMEKQIALGKEYFESRFGLFPRVGYNVDSFGHAATLPGLMRAAGQDRYIMMRPGPHEMNLPANLFRWRGYADGPTVLTFRIQDSYATRTPDPNHFRAATVSVPAGVEHTMCFVGVGDHGGGPTEQQIAFVKEHAHDIDGWEMKFSSPSRYFDAVAQQTQSVPPVVGELQQHAIGCYSVYRSVKAQVRRAEHLLAQAEYASNDPSALEGACGRITSAWEDVCFHHFHDTLGGTCLPTAYDAVSDQLGAARSAAAKEIAYALRRKAALLPDDLHQRMVFWNASNHPFSGYVEFEPWLGWQPLGEHAGLIDTDGRQVAHQFLASEAATEGMQRVLLSITADPGELVPIAIVRTGAAPVAIRAWSDRSGIHNDVGVTLTARSMRFGHKGSAAPQPAIRVFDDPSDTWSHGLDRYPDESVSTVTWQSRTVVDTGPLMASRIDRGRLGHESKVIAEWRVYAGEPFVGLDLSIDFREANRVVKLVLPIADQPLERTDGIMGGALVRRNDGRELPLRDWTRLGSIAIVCPDAYALDATPNRVRITLLRSPLMAHHEPHPGQSAAPRAVHSDQGTHRFRLRFYNSPDLSDEVLDRSARALQRPPIGADLTRGMSASVGEK